MKKGSKIIIASGIPVVAGLVVYGIGRVVKRHRVFSNAVQEAHGRLAELRKLKGMEDDEIVSVLVKLAAETKAASSRCLETVFSNRAVEIINQGCVMQLLSIGKNVVEADFNLERRYESLEKTSEYLISANETLIAIYRKAW